jgi:outer membrane protein
MLTLRHSLATKGALRAYAGAGINRTRYFVDQGDTQELLVRRNRDSAIGAAAELGAELRVSEQLMLSADLRWADLADDAELLRNDGNLIIADPVVLGLTVGWRFR